MTAQNDGEQVLIRARIQTSRLQGNKMVFLNLRQRTDTIQALMVVTKDSISKQMVKWAGSLAVESIVIATGIVKKSPEPIKSASVSEVELHIQEASGNTLGKIPQQMTVMIQIWLLSGIEGRLPFSLEDASRSETAPEVEGQFNKVLLETRLNNRVLDLRVSISLPFPKL